MSTLANLYGTSLGLLTDLYQLTMAYGYWKQNKAEQNGVFHLFFRKSPFKGGYTIAAGLQTAIEYLESFHFSNSDIEYLSTLTGNDDKPLFEPAFLDYLSELKLTLNIDAIPEGTVVFPHQPLVRVEGPMLQAQIIETPLLNLINFQTLIATKSARICRAAMGEPVLEFGLRRAQGIDGALTATRAAFIGGAAATSNILAGKLYGIPVRGTHAHSWVMSFDTEMDSFNSYADAMPNNCVFLVDTYDTLEGVRKATEVGKRLREDGHEMVGIRLDSGDLAYLSIEARKILDEAGFPDAKIVASNDLDEHLIESLKRQSAQVSVWGVGTKLATAFEQPALGGVYKLAAIEETPGHWTPKIKLSEQLIKTSTPGKLQVRRYIKTGRASADMIFNELDGKPNNATFVDPLDPSHQRVVSDKDEYESLLVPVIRKGKTVYDLPTLESIQTRTHDQLAMFHPTILRLDNPHKYPVGLEKTLYDLKAELMIQHRKREKISAQADAGQGTDQGEGQ
ncbi:MAG: nicotinate phosphoribosyltransferase [Mariniblastus sp.]